MRYRVSDLPAVGVGAFCPLPAIAPSASSFGLVEVSGAPGDVVLPSPRPAAVPSLTVVGGRNSAQSSDVSPDAWTPSEYVAYADNMGPAADVGIGMARRRYAELPQPALDPQRIPRVAYRPPPRLGGRTAMAWPRPFQRFPTR